MSETRVIKKYPNRRLYDTAISSYITLEDVKRLVLDGLTFHVIDARSGEDITRTILLQIISEQEEQGDPIFSTEVLAHIIRFYGDTLQGMIGRYLEQSMRGFVDQQHLFREQMKNFAPVNPGLNPLGMMSDFAEQNLAMWKSMQDKFYKQAQRESETSDDKPKSDD
jgi:polyhydroxyalkanoate synthesis repressor PhaR